jgi:hypothetical protein
VISSENYLDKFDKENPNTISGSWRLLINHVL